MWLSNLPSRTNSFAFRPWFPAWVVFLFLSCPTIEASPLFESHSVLDVELIGPIHSLDKTGEKHDEVPFVLRENGVEHDVMIRLRGKSRLRVCKFPPLRLRFEPGDSANETGPFTGISKLKLVTHCQNSDRGESNALEEYAAYRIFELLSDKSYRVRVMRVTYTDTDQRSSDKTLQRYGFVIEPAEQLASRSGGTPLRTTGLPVSRLNREQAGLVFVFQYLIGNTDWSFVMADGDDACCHNGDLLDIQKSIYYIPYDFDLSGIVNASYAKPDSTLRMKSVRQRRYRGYCMDSESVRSALRYVKSQESEIQQLAESLPGLSQKNTATMSEYLGKFFEKAQDEEKLMRLYEKRCVGKKI
jgi:hypothetical protein